MNEAVNALAAVREAIKEGKDAGESISLMALDDYLVNLQQYYIDNPEASYQPEIAAAQLHSSANIDAKMLEGVFNFAVTALKMLLLINGAAAIAIIAYLGRTPPPSNGVSQIINSMSYFAYGAGLSVLTALIAYLAQVVFTEGFSIPAETHEKWGAGLRLLIVVSCRSRSIVLYWYTSCFIWFHE